MTMRRLSLAVPLLAAACATVPPPAPLPPPAPGMERLIGATAAAATALLGKPTLDRSEGPGRQLQFARRTCVLDLYYYPDAKAGQPVARFAEARGRDGKVQDAGVCLRAQLAG